MIIFNFFGDINKIIHCNNLLSATCILYVTTDTKGAGEVELRRDRSHTITERPTSMFQPGHQQLLQMAPKVHVHDCNNIQVHVTLYMYIITFA